MSNATERHGSEAVRPNLERARRAALMAHGVVIKFKEIGLPESMDRDLASLSTDLGDLVFAHATLAEQMEGFLSSNHDWETIGNYLVDLRTSVDHISWHISGLRRPMTRITQHAYRRSLEDHEDAQ